MHSCTLRHSSAWAMLQLTLQARCVSSAATVSPSTRPKPFTTCQRACVQPSATEAAACRGRQAAPGSRAHHPAAVAFTTMRTSTRMHTSRPRPCGTSRISAGPTPPQSMTLTSGRHPCETPLVAPADAPPGPYLRTASAVCPPSPPRPPMCGLPLCIDLSFQTVYTLLHVLVVMIGHHMQCLFAGHCPCGELPPEVMLLAPYAPASCSRNAAVSRLTSCMHATLRCQAHHALMHFTVIACSTSEPANQRILAGGQRHAQSGQLAPPQRPPGLCQSQRRRLHTRRHAPEL